MGPTPVYRKTWLIYCRNAPHYFFNSVWSLERSQSTGIIADVLPVFKKCRKEDSGNYWLISLTSVTGKIMNKFILRVSEKYLRHNTVLSHKQHWFMRGKSCLTKLISFYDKVTHLVAQGKAVMWVLRF